jgi:hypothetical protein
MLQYRSVANSFIQMYPTVYVDEILNGNLNFFDVPFPSKVIFRNDGTLWLGVGAHSIRKPLRSHTLAVSSDELKVAHFPLLSRSTLDLCENQPNVPCPLCIHAFSYKLYSLLSMPCIPGHYARFRISAIFPLPPCSSLSPDVSAGINQLIETAD